MSAPSELIEEMASRGASPELISRAQVAIERSVGRAELFELVGHAGDEVELDSRAVGWALFTLDLQVIALVGGINIFGERRGSSLEISPEELVDAEPDICFVSWCGAPYEKLTLDNLKHRAGLESLSERARARVIQSTINQSSRSIHRPIEVAPLTLNFDISFDYISALTESPFTPSSQILSNQRRISLFPRAYDFMSKLNPSLKHDLTEIS